ncbi:hypothetical protein GCM10009677_39890 [Sphaerisporangium rubeum]|uniref:Uncharacterized protein n=1 Tax=Sphaerisporangium rubeum TaxID=321317 RepID=A0A7X0MB19_9ACTN|nr:hypothetical protein [Sphaerisporangium rubeum]MBB6476674.1 hypothetical protein [Sphaerisporangium rubeum]
MFKILGWVARSVFVLVRRPMCVTLVLIAALPVTAYVAWKAGGGGRPGPGVGPVVVTHVGGTPMGVRVFPGGDRPETVVRVFGDGGEGVFFTKDGPVGVSGKVFFIKEGPQRRAGKVFFTEDGDGPARGGPSR